MRTAWTSPGHCAMQFHRASRIRRVPSSGDASHPAQEQADAGNLREAADQVRGALALWRGPPLADVDAGHGSFWSALLWAREVTPFPARAWDGGPAG